MNTTTLPLFPLRTVMFPGGPIPLRIFEPRYLEMVATCMRHDHGFGICLARQGRDTDPQSEPVDIGTEMAISDFTRLEDGNLGITADGQQRFRVLRKWQTPVRLWMAEVTPIANEPAAAVPQDCEVLARLLAALYEELGEPWSERPTHYDNASWLGGRLVEILPLEPEFKQELLEMNEPVARLQRLLPVVREQHIDDDDDETD